VLSRLAPSRWESNGGTAAPAAFVRIARAG